MIITLFSLVSLLISEGKSFPPELSNSQMPEPGIWIIDLRPDPSADPYLKEFEITEIEGNTFSGVFYDTPFEQGILNGNWDKVYFAFSTSDQNSTYFHSGYFDGSEVHGMSFSPERSFIMPWRGQRE